MKNYFSCFRNKILLCNVIMYCIITASYHYCKNKNQGCYKNEHRFPSKVSSFEWVQELIKPLGYDFDCTV